MQCGGLGGYYACYSKHGGYTDQHGNDPPPLTAKDIAEFEQYERDPRFYEAFKQYRARDTKYNTPYVGGSDTSGTTVFHDKQFSDRVENGQVRYDGQPYDPRPFIDLHEIIEGVLLRHFGMQYPQAHRIASIGERLGLERAGLNWKSHTKAMAPEIKLAETESGKGTPPNLLVQPYKGTKYEHQVRANERTGNGAGAGASVVMAAQGAPPSGGYTNAAGGLSAEENDQRHDRSDNRGAEQQTDDRSPKGAGSRRFYLVRHGKTKLNAPKAGGASDKIRGWSDVPLDPVGHKEAIRLGNDLADSGITVLGHSNMRRTKDTAEPIAEKTGADVISWPEFRPWDVGVMTGESSNEVHPQLVKMARDAPDTKIQNGESFTQFKCRFLAGLAEFLLDKTEPDDVPAVVTHHRGERLVNAWLDGGQSPTAELHLPTMFQHGESPASSFVIAIDPERLRAAANFACEELKRIGPQKYGQDQSDFHEGHGPPTDAHPEGTHCGVCRYFGGEGKCERVQSKPMHIGADDGCALFMDPPEGANKMRKKGMKDGGGSATYGSTNWDEREGPGGSATGAPPRADGGSLYSRPGSLHGGGYDPELPVSAPGQQFAGANLPSTMGAGSFQAMPSQFKIGGYGSKTAGPHINAQIGGRGTSPYIGAGAHPPRAGGSKKPAGGVPPHRGHAMAIGHIGHALKMGLIDRKKHDEAVKVHRDAIAGMVGKRPGASPMRSQAKVAGGVGGDGKTNQRGGAMALGGPSVPQFSRLGSMGGYGGMGSIGQAMASPMGPGSQSPATQGQMPWQK